MVPFVDLKAQYQSIASEIGAAVTGVLESAQFVLGPEVSAFEREFASYCQAQLAVGTSTGTSALHLALLAAGVGPGDEVVTVSFTFVATVAAIRYCGAKPVFVDVDSRTYTMDPTQIEAVLTSKTKAIVPVHIYGQAADMDPILALAKARGLVVIEDACQAHGAEYKGRRVGALGDLGCFSFYPGKNLGAYGEGGAVTTNNPKFAKSVAILRDWGAETKYYHDVQGFNYRLEALQAAILRVKLRYLDGWNEARRSHANRYGELFAQSKVGVPYARPDAKHVFHVYAVRCQERDRIQSVLLERGIHTGIHYPIPVHLQKAHADLGYREGNFPITEKLSKQVLSLPMYAELNDAQLGAVAGALREAAQ